MGNFEGFSSFNSAWFGLVSYFMWSLYNNKNRHWKKNPTAREAGSIISALWRKLQEAARFDPETLMRCLLVAIVGMPKTLGFFPTCQVRVVRFYVSLFSFSDVFSSLLSSSSSSDLNCDPVSSVWRAGLQLRAREFSVACRTPTAILRVQCGVPDLNLRAREFSVACRTSTASS